MINHLYTVKRTLIKSKQQFKAKLIILGCTFIAVPSFAQAQNETQPNAPWSQDRQWLLGDWSGQRQALAEKGYRFHVALMSEAATNLSGGYNHSRRVENAAQLAMGLQLDLGKIAGWRNTQAALSVSKRDGNALTFSRINDPRAGSLSNVQEIYGRGKIWRLNQAWIQTATEDQRFKVKFGRMGMSEDFNGSHCEFQNLLLCGSQLGKTVGSIWFNSPVGIWGLNSRYQFATDWSLGLGLYEVNPNNAKSASNADGFDLNISDIHGVTIPVELRWAPKLDLFNGLPGEYKVGALYSTADASDVKIPSKSHSGKHSYWFNAQQQLSQRQSDAKRGIFISVNGTLNDTASTAVQSTQQIALWYKGPFEQRPHDSIGLGLANYVVNERVRDRQRDQNAVLGFDGYDPIDPNYHPIQHDELNLELNYTYHWSPALMVRPNLQYIYQPGGIKEVDNAWVAGLSMRVNF